MTQMSKRLVFGADPFLPREKEPILFPDAKNSQNVYGTWQWNMIE